MSKYKLLSCIGLFTLFIYTSCQEDGLVEPGNNIRLANYLSEYNIFKGEPSDLIPNDEFVLYELSAQLFSDYAEKQRLVKVPAGEFLNAKDDKLPGFPEGTIIAKTFYYYNDKRDTTRGKKIIETRLLVKTDSKWTVGTYLWNEEQNNARLITTGFDKTVNWIDERGVAKVISYHIPANRECASCHNSNETVVPIGPKLRNLNREVDRSGSLINQLSYLNDRGIFNAINPSSFSKMSSPHDASLPVTERARAYLDVNCGHCHKRSGSASDTRLFMGYDLPFGETNIDRKKRQIEELMSRGYMPQLGTTVIDEEGMQLIEEYLKNL